MTPPITSSLWRCGVVLAATLFAASTSNPVLSVHADHPTPAGNDEYIRLIGTYASGRPDAAVERLARYGAADLERLTRENLPSRSQLARLTNRDIKAAALLHGEVAVRLPAETAALLVRTHALLGSSFALRLKDGTEGEFCRAWFVAVSQPLLDDLPTAALDLLSRARQAYPDDPQIAVAVGAALENLASRLPIPTRIWGKISSCAPGQHQRCLREAERTYLKVLDRDPSNIEVRLRIGRVRQLLGQASEEADLRQVRATQRHPYATLATLFLAQAAGAKGHVADAARLYATPPNEEPGYVAAVGLSAMLEQQGDIAGALQTLLPALATDRVTRDLDAWMRYKQGRLDPSLRSVAELRSDLVSR